MNKQIFKWILSIAFLGLSGLVYSCGRDLQPQLLTRESPAQEWEEDRSGEEPSAAAALYVHICGEVVSPGVYEMEEGGRLFQAVEKAGGFTGQAAPEYLNMAEVIRDGMKIVVPARSELDGSELNGPTGFPSVSQGFTEGNARININTASREELMTLSGIGESRAADIIRYRQEQGPFKKIEEIMDIPGIKDAAFEKIKDHITV